MKKETLIINWKYKSSPYNNKLENMRPDLELIDFYSL